MTLLGGRERVGGASGGYMLMWAKHLRIEIVRFWPPPKWSGCRDHRDYETLTGW